MHGAVVGQIDDDVGERRPATTDAGAEALEARLLTGPEPVEHPRCPVVGERPQEASLLWREVVGDPEKVGERAPVGVEPLEIDADRRAFRGGRAGDGAGALRGEECIEREATAPRQIEARWAIREGHPLAAEIGPGEARLTRRARRERHPRRIDPESLPEEAAEEAAANDEPVAIDSIPEASCPRLFVRRERRGQGDRSPGVTVGEGEGEVGWHQRRRACASVGAG